MPQSINPDLFPKTAPRGYTRVQAKEERFSCFHGRACTKHLDSDGERYVSSNECVLCNRERKVNERKTPEGRSRHNAINREHKRALREDMTLPVYHIYSIKLQPLNGSEPIYKLGITKRPYFRCERLLKEVNGHYATLFKHSVKTKRLTPTKVIRDVYVPMRLIAVSNKEKALSLEKMLLERLKSYSVKPLCRFSGHTECLSVDPLDYLSEVA